MRGDQCVGAYGYLEAHQLPLPVATPNGVLGVQAGICGDAVIAFAAIMQQLGYQVRSVQFYFDKPVPDNHIGVEVFYAGGWHYFDPTFGAYWSDSSSAVLSIDAIRAGEGVEHKDSTGFTNVIEDPWFDGDATGFITDPDTTVVVGADNLTG
jgi:transglutaminase-like putative cysteine protease